MPPIPGVEKRRLASGDGCRSVDGVSVFDSPTGLGVFACRAIPGGQEILVFRGNVIDFHGTLRKGDRECDALQVAAGVYLDLDPPGRYVNHSCEPNAGVRDGVRLVSLREIRKGEEIRFDYSSTMDEDHWTLECRCGAPRCRRIIRDFKALPTRLKLKMIRQNVVPSFLLAREIEHGRLAVSGGRVVSGAGRA